MLSEIISIFVDQKEFWLSLHGIPMSERKFPSGIRRFYLQDLKSIRGHKLFEAGANFFKTGHTGADLNEQT